MKKPFVHLSSRDLPPGNLRMRVLPCGGVADMYSVCDDDGVVEFWVTNECSCGGSHQLKELDVEPVDETLVEPWRANRAAARLRRH